jgi:ankyrin repeat protein
VDASDNHGKTPLLEAHQPSMMALLLEKGANVNACEESGTTKLHHICMMESNVTLLVQAGIDVHAKNNKGETALATAIHYNKQDLVNRLLQEGADPNAIDNKGWTALHVASDRGGRADMMGPLFEAGVNVNAASDSGTTALHIAVRRSWDRDFENVKKLLEHRADANAITQNGSTPLGVAILGRWQWRIRQCRESCVTRHCPASILEKSPMVVHHCQCVHVYSDKCAAWPTPEIDFQIQTAPSKHSG